MDTRPLLSIFADDMTDNYKMLKERLAKLALEARQLQPMAPANESLGKAGSPWRDTPRTLKLGGCSLSADADAICRSEL
jgi:hypothetical protein